MWSQVGLRKHQLSFDLRLLWIPFSLLSLSESLDLKGDSCRQHVCGFCFCVQSATLFLSIEAFIPFIFKVITGRCMFTAILLILFFLFFSSSLLSSFVIWWLSLVLCLDSFLFCCMCVHYRFLVCGYHEVYIDSSVFGYTYIYICLYMYSFSDSFHYSLLKDIT